MTEVPPPDWAALYQKHRDAMYRVAAHTLRSAGRATEAEDVVMTAIESLMARPPRDVQNWEAMMVRATKLRALDLLKSAAVRHASGAELSDAHGDTHDEFENDVIEAVDRQRAAAAAWSRLVILDERQRFIVSESIINERRLAELAVELDISPGRASQIRTEALKRLKEALEMEGVTA